MVSGRLEQGQALLLEIVSVSAVLPPALAAAGNQPVRIWFSLPQGGRQMRPPAAGLCKELADGRSQPELTGTALYRLLICPPERGGLRLVIRGKCLHNIYEQYNTRVIVSLSIIDIHS